MSVYSLYMYVCTCVRMVCVCVCAYVCVRECVRECMCVGEGVHFVWRFCCKRRVKFGNLPRVSSKQFFDFFKALLIVVTLIKQHWNKGRMTLVVIFDGNCIIPTT